MSTHLLVAFGDCGVVTAKNAGKAVIRAVRSMTAPRIRRYSRAVPPSPTRRHSARLRPRAVDLRRDGL